VNRSSNPMIRKALLPRRPRKPPSKRPAKAILKLLENDLIKRVSYEEYREKVRDVYGGPQGAFLATASLLSLHIHLGDRLLRERRFDLRGVKNILDVGSGAGQIAKHLLKYADHDANITCCDLSPEMLQRSRTRLKSTLPAHVAADLSRLPFADGSFDCVTCGYVLEHLPDARLGLSELARVMQRGGRMLLLTTEDNFSGAWTSRFWCCRTYNRKELFGICQDLGLVWKNELWFTRMHKLLRAGGICVEIEKR
ncbi:MAG TPA: class I SAM-dependent methyltransferase, partial [Pirellulales bacterium]|nr:class I SAM-dependent methyltransferase [Pirellulales bacterium]